MNQIVYRPPMPSLQTHGFPTRRSFVLGALGAGVTLCSGCAVAATGVGAAVENPVEIAVSQAILSALISYARDVLRTEAVHRGVEATEALEAKIAEMIQPHGSVAASDIKICSPVYVRQSKPPAMATTYSLRTAAGWQPPEYAVFAADHLPLNLLPRALQALTLTAGRLVPSRGPTPAQVDAYMLPLTSDLPGATIQDVSYGTSRGSVSLVFDARQRLETIDVRGHDKSSVLRCHFDVGPDDLLIT